MKTDPKTPFRRLRIFMLLFMLLGTLSPLSVPAFVDETGSGNQTTEVTGGEGDTGDTGNTDGAVEDVTGGDTGNTGDSGDTGNTDGEGEVPTGGEGDNADTGDAGDSGDTGNTDGEGEVPTGDAGDLGDAGDTGDTEENLDAQFTIQQEDESFGLCHATNSPTNQYRYISPNDSSYDQHLANHFGPGGGDRFATQAEYEAGRCFNDSVVTFVKYFCTVNELVAPAPVIGEPGENCELATAEQLADLNLSLSDGVTTFTTDDLLTGIRLAPGTYTLLEGGVAVGTVEITVTGANLTFNVLNYIAAPTFEVDIDKYFCTVNALEAPDPEIGTPGDNCELATDQEFMLSIDGQTFTTAELLAGVQLAPGDYDLYEGTTFVGTITVVDTDQTVNVLNYIAMPEGSVSVSKYICEGLEEVTGGIDMAAPVDGCVESTAVFDILDSEGVSVLGAGDDVFAGVTLPAGEYTLVELGTEFEVPFTIAAESDIQINVYNPAEEEEPWITILKRFCQGDNSDGNVSNCNGREAPDVDVTFTVVGNGVDDTIVVDEFDQAAGSQGQARSDFALEAGETYLVCEIEPDGWMGVARALGANQTAGETPNCVYVTLTPGNNQVQFHNFMRDVPVDETGTLIVKKYFCTDEGITVPVVGDEGDYEDCEPATAEQLEGVNFLIYPFGNAAAVIDIDDSLLLSTGVVLPVGTHTLVEVLDGVTHVMGNFEIKAGETTTIIVFNPVEMEDENGARITILKRFCEEDRSQSPNDNCTGRVSVPSDTEVVFTVYAGEGTDGDVVGTIVVTDFNQGNGSQDSATSGFDLVAGNTYTVCEEPLEGWVGEPRPDPQGGANQTELEDCIVVTLTPGNNVLQFVNYMEVPEETGTLIVEKYFCTDENITVPVVGDEGDYEDCEPATAEQLEGVNFLVYPFGDAEAAIDIDDSALLSTGVVLPVGTHTLVEVLDSVTHVLADITVTADGTTTIIVFNPVVVPPVEEEIRINIWKFVCSEIDKHAGDDDDPCVYSYDLDGTEIAFTVTYVIGDEETTVETSLEIEGAIGSAVLTLPLADSYTVCEIVPEGVEGVAFAIDVDGAEVTEDGCITFSGAGLSDGDVVSILFWNDLEDGKPVTPEKPVKPVTPGKPVVPVTPAQPGAGGVTMLPSTGSGAEASNDAIASLTLLAGAAALAGTGMLLRKERPAA